jgi:hypothetical protein
MNKMKLQAILSVVICAFLSINAHCQMNWAPEGATWHFSYGEVCFNGYNMTEVHGDSIVGGQQCKVLKSHIYGYACGGAYTSFMLEDELTYADTDRVYHWTGDSFEILYDFLLVPGDIYVVGAYSPCEEGDSLLVTETGVLNINGVDLRYYDVQHLNDFFGGSIYGRIVERLGPIESYLFPLPHCLMDIMQSGPFRCYQDAEFGVYSSNVFPNCDYLGMNDISATKEMISYPNPTSSNLTIQLPNTDNWAVRVFNSNGQLVSTEKINQSNFIQLNIQNLNTGLYTVQAMNDNGKVYTEVVVKE